ncbi:MAG: prenyltransferase/squalene oxidase repeat-containing protein [Planctomycetota bacterium]
MDKRLQQYREMGLRAAQFTMSKQQPDGGYIWEGFVKDAYHKQPYSWSVSGLYAPVHRLLNWVKKTTLQPEGGLKDYNGDVYKQSWFFQGCHRSGRFDISYPIMEFLLSCQRPCGGFPHFPKHEVCRALATAWTGVSALYFGRLDVAEKVSEWCVRLLDQPAREKFFFQTTNDGKLLTDETDPKGAFIDFAKPNQCYWELSLPWMHMGRMYMATGDKEFLDHAEKFFEIHRRFYKDQFHWMGSGKSSLAAAIHYLNTDDTRARDGVLEFLDYLQSVQHPNGGWRADIEQDIPLIYIDHAAEFNVWIQEDVNILAAMG